MSLQTFAELAELINLRSLTLECSQYQPALGGRLASALTSMTRYVDVGHFVVLIRDDNSSDYDDGDGDDDDDGDDGDDDEDNNVMCHRQKLPGQ